MASFLRAHHCHRRPSGGPAGGKCRSSAHPGACSAPRASAGKERGTFFGLRRTPPILKSKAHQSNLRPAYVSGVHCVPLLALYFRRLSGAASRKEERVPKFLSVKGQSQRARVTDWLLRNTSKAQSEMSELSEGFLKRYRGENDERKSFHIHSI